MNNLKCPFCQQELEEETFSGGRVFVSCNNPNCIISDWGGCSKQIITELIRTRKALEWARHFLKEIRSLFLLEKDNPARQNKWVDTAIRMWGWAEDALEQITALEQKD